jgi:hypothetical protein
MSFLDTKQLNSKPKEVDEFFTFFGLAIFMAMKTEPFD